MDNQIAGSILNLNSFLINAPGLFSQDVSLDDQHPHALIHRYKLDDDYIVCVRWVDDFYITGTDLFKIISFKIVKFGRSIRDQRKFNEGISSDLRNLKIGIDSVLEENGSSLLDLLFRFGAIRTQKKQKVFKWHSVPHDRMFLDALERDIKREAAGNTVRMQLHSCVPQSNQLRAQTSTVANSDPSFLIKYDQNRSLQQQFDDCSLTPVFLLGTKNGSEFYKQGKTLKKILQKRSTIQKDLHRLPPWNQVAHLTSELPDERSFRCEECGKAFKRHEHLRRHKRSHTKERPFSCDVCLKSFTRSDNLAVHARTHFKEGKKTYRKVSNKTSDSDNFSECSSTYMSSLTSSDSASHYSSRPSTANHWTDSPKQLLDSRMLPFGESFEPSSGPIRRHRSEDTSTATSFPYLEQQDNTGYSHSLYGSSLPNFSNLNLAYSPIHQTQSSSLEFDYTVPRTTQSLPSFENSSRHSLAPYTIPTSSADLYEDDFKTPTVANFGFTYGGAPTSATATAADRMSTLGLSDDYTNNCESHFAYQPPPLVEDSVSTPIQAMHPCHPDPHYLPYQYYNTYDGFEGA